MAVRIGDRNQYTLLPPLIDNYVTQDFPVRAYEAFVEVLDLKELGLNK